MPSSTPSSLPAQGPNSVQPQPSTRPLPRAAQPQRRRTSSPRSLADELRSWPDADLVALLRARPDLVVPRPNEFATLITRAASPAAVQRAIDGLDTAQLQVLEVLAALPEPVTAAEVSRRWGAPAGPVLTRLRGLALVWGSSRALHLVRAARDVLGPHPAGLGPPLAEALGRRSPQRLAQLLEDLGLPPTGDPETALARVTGHLSRTDVLEGLLADAPSGVRAVLDRLTWGQPVGQVSHADRVVHRSLVKGPVEWLLAHGMLAVADSAHVVLPREVGLALRGGRVHRAPQTTPPSLTVRARGARTVSGTAAGAAAELVRLVEALGEQWGAAPPPVLRAGGVGIRELHRTAVVLEVDDATAAFVIELAFVTGLVADDAGVDPRWAPTPAYDTWRTGSTGRRWAELAVAWLHTTRCPQLVGTRDARDTPHAALGERLDRAVAPAVRRWVLQSLAEAALPADPPPNGTQPGRTHQGGPQPADPPPNGTQPGRTHQGGPQPGDPQPGGRQPGGRQRVGPGRLATPAPDQLAAVDPRALRDRLDWLSPRRSRTARQTLVDWVLDDAARVGVVGAGALAPHGRTLLERHGDLDVVARALDACLPEPVDHILLQADLTAVAPGPPEPDLARELTLMADVESRGGATVYRFSPSSVRRALDAGRTADDVLTLLTARSRTEVPQPLAYLVADVARRHGRVRVGSAQAFVRADDEATLAALLAERKAGPLRLRRLAPTVLAAQAPAPVVLNLLREIGLAPVAENPDGDVVLAQRERHRTGHRSPPRPVPAVPSPLGPLPSPVDEATLAGVVAIVRATDRLAGQHRPARDAEAPAVPAGDTGTVIARLREAASRQETVWIGYTDADGRATPQLVQPLQVDGGQLQAVDQTSLRVRTFVVHRVTGVIRAHP
jgi:hypothetical protein